ncbi:GDSL lipase/esterase [Thamnocephalis sphaerospora]|uniref:GDSL lipase/esterase n=1 Tax=Thamnocephalis sphaerospora TaxID=78915 RepID=A0A4P9XIG8_9FUNG|nr:GDSL lipase/esterase [Thamnocephalis sphaerospora]|eukprot:RKP05488.1 GDSL lipase/esterase [Thamnocephalis sphaerospora]
MFRSLILLAALVAGGSALVTPTTEFNCPRGYSRLVTFGDSLTDTGNTFRLSNQQTPNPALYAAGRFSNGPVWTEYAAQKIGIQYRDYAYGGATSDNRLVNGVVSSTDPTVVPSTYDQAYKYLPFANANRFQARQALYTIIVGANDYVNALKGGMDINAQFAASVVDRIVNVVDTLYKTAGAQEIIVSGLPLIEATPYIQAMDVSVQNAFKQISALHNMLLADKVKEYAAKNQNINLKYFDLSAYTRKVIEDKDKHGFAVVDKSCLDKNTGAACANPEEYFFWDPLHPTTKGHKLLADGIIAMLA